MFSVKTNSLQGRVIPKKSKRDPTKIAELFVEASRNTLHYKREVGLYRRFLEQLDVIIVREVKYSDVLMGKLLGTTPSNVREFRHGNIELSRLVFQYQKFFKNLCGRRSTIRLYKHVHVSTRLTRSVVRAKYATAVAWLQEQDYFVSVTAIAQRLGMVPGYVSRYMSGHRSLKRLWGVRKHPRNRPVYTKNIQSVATTTCQKDPA